MLNTVRGRYNIDRTLSNIFFFFYLRFNRRKCAETSDNSWTIIRTFGVLRKETEKRERETHTLYHYIIRFVSVSRSHDARGRRGEGGEDARNPRDCVRDIGN